MLFYSDSSNKQLESMRQKINLHTEQVQQLKSDVNKLTSEKLQIDSDLQQRYKLEEDKAKLLSENDQYDKEVTVQSWNTCIMIYHWFHYYLYIGLKLAKNWLKWNFMIFDFNTLKEKSCCYLIHVYK